MANMIVPAISYKSADSRSVHSRTMRGECSAVFAESEDGDFVALAEHTQRIAELEAKLAAKWISVDERLPEATQGKSKGRSSSPMMFFAIAADGGIHEVCNYDHEDGLWTLVHKGSPTGL